MLQPTPNAFSTIKLPNGTTLNNLAAQVEENKQLIAQHYNIDRVLADFGLHVLGRLDDSPITLGLVGTEYGDAYLVGANEPYTVFVWTRANEDLGQPDPYWLNIGAIAIEGPVGPQGPIGPQGPTGASSRWYSFSSVNVPPNGNYNDGDMAFISMPGASLGDTYIYNGTSQRWVKIANIKGPQGVVGPQGPTGPQGIQGVAGPAGPQGAPAPIATIRGTVSSVEDLPTPTISIRGDAYLINDNVYVIFGPDDALVWMNIGPLNAGTVVYEDGLAKSTWSADTKLDVPANGIPSGAGERFIMIDQQGNVYYRHATGFTVGSIPLYSSAAAQNPLVPTDATIYAATPLADGHVANKKYVDDSIAAIGGGGADESAYEHNIEIQARSVDSGPINIRFKIVNNIATAATSSGNFDTLLPTMVANVPYMASGYIREPSGYVAMVTGVKKNSSNEFTVTYVGFSVTSPAGGVYQFESWVYVDEKVIESYNWWEFPSIQITDSVQQIH